jgi:dihydrolipoamide dehydrogenase
VVAANILGQRREADYSAIPRCVFTMPSVFAVGIVPEAAKAGNDAEAYEAPEDSASQAGEDGGSRRFLRIAKLQENPEAPREPDGAVGSHGSGPALITVRAELGDTARARLSQDDLGCLELYADAETGVLAGAVAVGPDAATWMSEVTLAIRAKIAVTVLADVVHAFPTYGEALETALRALGTREAPGTRGAPGMLKAPGESPIRKEGSDG